MVLKFYSNAVSQASKNVAAGIFILGLLLIGFGMIIFALPELFAFLAAAVFFIAGIGCGITAIKIFWTLRKINKSFSNDTDFYRKNVTIHHEEKHYDT